MKREYGERLDNAMKEIAAANSDNKELREQLVASELFHKDRERLQDELQARISELEPSSSELTAARARIAELEMNLEQERGKRHELRNEFARIETQLAQHAFTADSPVGPSLSLHEAPMPFVTDVRPEAKSTVEPSPAPDEQCTAERPDSGTPAISENSIVKSAPELGDIASPTLTTADRVADETAGQPDDLKRIKGIGPVLETRLNKLGISTIAQIAEFDEADIARVDQVLNFKGRIRRERWVDQARAMIRER